MIAKYVAGGLTCAIGLTLCAATVVGQHFATAVLILILAVTMFILIINIARKADDALEALQKVSHLFDMGERK